MTSWQNYYQPVMSTGLGREREFVVRRGGELMSVVVKPRPFEVVKQ